MISQSRMREFIGEINMNKVCIWILSCHFENKDKVGCFEVSFTSFRSNIFTSFPKKMWWWGKLENQVFKSKLIHKFEYVDLLFAQ